MPHQVQMYRERVRTVGISLLGGNSGVEGPYELGIDSISAVNVEDVTDTAALGTCVHPLAVRFSHRSMRQRKCLLRARNGSGLRFCSCLKAPAHVVGGCMYTVPHRPSSYITSTLISLGQACRCGCPDTSIATHSRPTARRMAVRTGPDANGARI